MTTNVLILCTHDSARSVLSEGMLNHWAAKRDTMSDADLQVALTTIVES